MQRFVLNGPYYCAYFTELNRIMRPRSYLEVGVNKGDSFREFSCFSVGIDPNFRIMQDVILSKPSVHLYQMGSDDFFATHAMSALLPHGVDLAFLDGMHHFEFLLRDFLNTERHCHGQSVIFLHDCVPIQVEMTERDFRPEERTDLDYQYYWTGDVWKLVPILRQYRPDLVIDIIDCSPTGIVAVSNLDPKSTVLADAYDRIVQDFGPQMLDDAGLAAFHAGLTLVPASQYLAEVTPFQ